MIKMHRSELAGLIGVRSEISDPEVKGYVVCIAHYSEEIGTKGFVFRSESNLEKCMSTKDIIKSQAEELKEEISTNRWYMGEREHHAITAKEAELDYLKKYVVGFAKGFRKAYCKDICQHGSYCNLKGKGEEIMDDD